MSSRLFRARADVVYSLFIQCIKLIGDVIFYDGCLAVGKHFLDLIFYTKNSRGKSQSTRATIMEGVAADHRNSVVYLGALVKKVNFLFWIPGMG